MDLSPLPKFSLFKQNKIVFRLDGPFKSLWLALMQEQRAHKASKRKTASSSTPTKKARGSPHLLLLPTSMHLQWNLVKWQHQLNLLC